MKIIFVIIGALIGAGFASGQEIYLFFYKYGKNGIYGLVLCSIFMGIIIYKTFLVLLRDRENNIKNYKDFLEQILPSHKKKFLNLGYVLNVIINIFLLITFYIMISGFGAYFKQEFGINSSLCAMILAMICFFVFMTNVKGVIKVNSIIVPTLICFIIILGIINWPNIEIESVEENIISSKNWMFQSVIYCSYNMILLIPVLINLKQYIKNLKQAKIISIICSCIVFILALNIYLLLLKVDVKFDDLEMPVIYVITKFYPYFKTIYGIVILLSIFSTAISIGISFLKNTVKNKKNFPQVAIIMCITSVVISNFGFSNLVKTLFPCLGYIGLVQFFYIMLFIRQNN